MTVIPQWDVENLYDGACVVAFGARKTGKTVSIRNIMYAKKDSVATWIYISPTYFNSPEIHAVIPGLFCYSGLTPELMSKILMRQAELKAMKEQGEIPADTNISIGIICDDNAFDAAIFRHPLMRWMIFNGRHYFIHLFLCFQYMMGFPRELRVNVDVTLATHEEEEGNLERLYPLFPFFNTFAEFKEQFKKGTLNYVAWVSVRDGGKQTLKWFKGVEPDHLPPHRLGTPEQWRLTELFFSKEKVRKYSTKTQFELKDNSKKKKGKGEKEEPRVGIDHLIEEARLEAQPQHNAPAPTSASNRKNVDEMTIIYTAP